MSRNTGGGTAARSTSTDAQVAGKVLPAGPVEGGKARRAPADRDDGHAGRSDRSPSDVVLPCLGLAGLLAIWALLSASGMINELLLPSPLAVIKAGIDEFANGVLVPNVAISVKRVLAGYVLAVTVGVGVGLLVGWNNRLWYKTTGGLVAPSDRMYIAKPPESQGMEFPEGVKSVGFITAANGWKNMELFHFDPWKSQSFGGAGDISKDLVDPAFDTPACN